MTARDNEALVRRAFTAFNQGDMDTMQKEILADGITYRIGGRSPVAGEHHGPGPVLDVFATLARLTGGTFRAELDDVIASENRAVALFASQAERGGRQLDAPSVIVFTVSGGRITRAQAYAYDAYDIDAFLSG